MDYLLISEDSSIKDKKFVFKRKKQNRDGSSSIFQPDGPALGKNF